MYSEEDLDSAVQAGALSDEAATAFRAHVARLRKAPAVDEEHFRLVTGFNDIFVVIACALLLSALWWIGKAYTSWLGALLVAAASWLLAEYFTRRRRMALPSIGLLLSFVGTTLALGWIVLPTTDTTPGPALACAMAGIAAWAHWLRFKVPITVAAGVGALAGCLILLFVLYTPPEVRRWLNVFVLATGFAVFALALRWDASDRARQTRRSDVAFWLHLLAAPLLVHPVFSFLDVFSRAPALWQAAVVLALYLVMGIVSLSVDRRALMVSALAYVLYPFSALLKEYGVVSLSFAVTAAGIGAALLLLSAFWHRSRNAVVSLYPPAIRERLAPLR